MKRFALILLLVFFIHRSFSQSIKINVPETDGEIKAMVTTGDTLIFGGFFSRVYTPENSSAYFGILNSKSGVLLPNIARPNNRVDYILPDGSGGYFICGIFTKVGDSIRHGIAHIDSNGAVSSGLSSIKFETNSNNGFNGMRLMGDTLFVYGKFTRVNNVLQKYIVAINVSSNSTIHWNPDPNEIVTAIEIVGNEVFLAGKFNKIGSVTRNLLASVNLNDTGSVTSWNPNCTGGIPYVLKSDGRKLFVGGSFTSFGGITRRCLASFNLLDSNKLTSWNPDANGEIVSGVYCIDFEKNNVSNKIYVGGNFKGVGGYLRNNIACLDSNGIATSWNPNSNREIITINLFENQIYVLGGFSTIGGKNISKLAIIDKDNASALNFVLPYFPETVGNPISTIYVGANGIYIGGKFEKMGGKVYSGIAAYNFTTEKLIENWIPDKIYAQAGGIAIAGDKVVIAGGRVDQLNLATGKRIPIPNGGIFSANPGEVKGLIIKDDIAYIYGSFEKNLGLGKVIKYLCAVNLKSGFLHPFNIEIVGSSVNSAQLVGNELYFGGMFIGVNGMVRNNLASINILDQTVTTWNPNIKGSVNSLCVLDSNIFIGGNFDKVSDQSRKNIALLKRFGNGELLPWNPVCEGTVSCIYNTNKSILISGNFDSIGGKPRNGIAILNTDFDSAIVNPFFSSQLDYRSNNVNTVLMKNNIVYAGGTFAYNRAYLAGINVNDTFGKLTLDKNIVESNYKGDTSYIQVFSDTNWTVTNFIDSWLSVLPDSGFGNAKLTIVTAPNMNQINRDALVEVSTGSITKSVLIAQKTFPTALNSVLNKDKQINIYPNPTTGIITIDFDLDASQKTIEVFDLLGNLIAEMETTENKYSFNFSPNQKGIYIIKVKIKDQNFVRKIIIEN
jgi:hypothetical protein